MKNKLTFYFLTLMFGVMSLAQGQEVIDRGNRTFDLNLQMPKPEILQLAAAQDVLGVGAVSSESLVSPAPKYRDRWITGNKVHKYAGIGSISLAIVAGLAPKEFDGLHEQAARGALGLGVVAVGTGVAFHYEDLSASAFISNPDNTHAVLTTLGVLGYAVAVDKGGETGHAEAGVTGAVLMLAGIKMTW